MHPYLCHTPEERAEMLTTIGVPSMEALYAHIPAAIRTRGLELPPALSEWEVQERLRELAGKNVPLSQVASFLGAGTYRRYIPAVVDAVLSRSEFYTAYTPYQPEISQGTLQTIYEFQTMVCELTGLEVANASMYDGATATAEAALMAMRLNRREKVLVANTLHPEYREVIRTYTGGIGAEIAEVPHRAGLLDADALGRMLAAGDVAGVLVQVPSFLGTVEDLRPIAEQVHAAGALLIVVAEPISLGLLVAPGHAGADIVVGDGQPLGNPVSFGGPHVGFMACREALVRQLPGRIAGASLDSRGQRVFTLTLQTREQHIRREKAISNICTNQALNALGTSVALAMLGREGLRELATTALQRAHHLAARLRAVPGFSTPLGTRHFNEFVLEVPGGREGVVRMQRELAAEGILPGVALARWYPEFAGGLLVCVTETNSPDQLDRYAGAAERFAAAARVGV